MKLFKRIGLYTLFLVLLTAGSLVLSAIFPPQYIRAQAPLLQQLGLAYWNSSTNAWAPFSGEFSRSTYAYTKEAYAPQATPASIITVLGSATKTVRVTRVWVSCRATAATFYRLRTIKYSTAYTVGTASAVTAIPYDSAFAAATAVVNTWSGGAPTEGTPVGQISDDLVPCNAVTMTATQPYGQPPQLLLDFANRPSSAVVLRGVAQYYALDGAAVALPAGFVVDVKVETVEDNS